MGDSNAYRVSARWIGAENGLLEVEEVPIPIPFSAPAEFGGQSRLWTPEHLLLAAVASCFVTTFRAVARISKFEFDGLEITAEGTIGKPSGGWQFTSITLRTTLRVQQESGRERGLRLLEKAERSCLIARSLAVGVLLEASVEVTRQSSPVAEEEPAGVAG